MSEVLVCGVYLADRENLARSAMEEFAASIDHSVTQRWVALDLSGAGRCDLPFTVATIRERSPKFTLINRLIADVDAFDRLVICDDDVQLPEQFLDNFVAFVEEFRFALAQPARTHASYIDHFITSRMPGLRARQTRFVEIGPVTCIDRAAYSVLLPFDQLSPMGWGLDFVWPVIAERHGLRLGIVDATPVGHSMREPATCYAVGPVEEQMSELLRQRPSLSQSEAFTVLEGYA